MPSKLRKALGAVKDQTSISLAKVTNAANLEVTILKATTHDKNPIEERYVNEIMQLVSSNKVYAAACAQSIGKRIGKTRNWVVALKSLMIVLRIFQDGDPYFPREVFHAMKRGAKILNLSSFRDDSNSSPWDYTAFVRTFALYLDERLDCFLTGKLQRRFTYHNRPHEKNQRNNKLSDERGIKDMKPTMVLDRITYWQRLLDRAMGTRPTGSAKTSRLVQITLYAIVQESFDLYRDISDGLAVVLDNFFQLPYQACLTAFQACVKSSKQFNDLSVFYSFCASIGVGRPYEYPSVQNVSEELMETLQEFLKDQASLPANNGSKNFPFSTPQDHTGSSSSQDDGNDRYGALERFFGSGSDFGSQCTSLEDLMCSTDAALSPRRSIEQDMCSEQSEQDGKQSPYDDFASANDSCSSKSFPIDHASRSSLDIISFDDLQQEVQQDQTNDQREQQNTKTGSSNSGSKDCWELVLAKTVTAPAETSPEMTKGFDPFAINTFLDQSPAPQLQYNPFLDEDIGTVTPHTTANSPIQSQATLFDVFDAEPRCKAIARTFHAENPIEPTTLTAPTFRAQGSAESNLTAAPTFRADETFDGMTPAPCFQSHPSFRTGTSTFHAHNSHEARTSPTFSMQNVDITKESPTLAARSPSESMVPPTFQAQNFYHTTASPTFSAKDSHETTMAITPREDDPFGPWPGEMTNEHAFNESMQEQNLLRQQQMWLEQQNKIIAKAFDLNF